jgi:hypothetical protein
MQNQNDRHVRMLIAERFFRESLENHQEMQGKV